MLAIRGLQLIISILVDKAVDQAHVGLFYNMGQCCTAASRCYVQDGIYDDFVQKSVEKAKRKRVGDPFDSKNEAGPQVCHVWRAFFNSFLDL